MARLIDPNDLVPLAQLAGEFGYHPDYLRNLARQNKIEAWLFAKTWVSTREAVREYKRNAPPPGRPKRVRRKT